MEKPQFDILIGGKISLPSDLDYVSFGQARTKEIIALSKAIAEPKRNALVFQQLPRHMRRRVMGHNSKRVPRIVREAHQRQLEKSGLPPPTKRPSRKHRRRPTNLLSEYNRRQKKFMWLETHIWHAKRFHMIDKWGYKMANFPNDKSFRACYRASSKHCLLHDVSYYSCIQLEGSLGQLLNGLESHTSQQCGLTFGARAYLDGAREGSVMMFRQRMFPYGAVGKVSFLWRPLENEDDTNDKTVVRTLWVWIHPAFYAEVLEELIGTFGLTIDLAEEVKLDTKATEQVANKRRGKSQEKQKVEEMKLATRNVPFARTPKYRNTDGIEMCLLKDTLNRFRLTGPLSQAILYDALKIVQMQSSQPHLLSVKTKPVFKVPSGDIDDIFALMSEPMKVTEEEVEEEPRPARPWDWWTQLYAASSFHRAATEAQSKLWQKFGEVISPAQLPPHLVIGLTVCDPRLSMPQKRKKAVPDDSKEWQRGLQSNMLVAPPNACASSIWCSSVRDISTQHKLSETQVNSLRSSNLVPGFTDSPDSCQTQSVESEEGSRIPVLLIQRPGSQEQDVKRLGFASGWDVIVPGGWGMPLWLSLVFRGARVGGLKEETSLARESATVSTLAPDSMAGRREASANEEVLVERYFRLPPKKRPNFIKLGISSPFSCAWDILVREWFVSQSEQVASSQCSVFAPAPFLILRAKQTLALLQSVVAGKRTNVIEVEQTAARLHGCLVPVTLRMVHAGTPVDHSVVCIPSEHDLEHFDRDSSYSGPVDGVHVDANADERKQMRAEHEVLLKRMRKQRVRKNRKAAGIDSVETAAKKPNVMANKDVVNEYAAKMRSLWLPPCSAVKDVGDRCTVGYVTHGDFLFTESCGGAVGYVVLRGLLQLVAARADKKPVYVLVRNPTSRQYRFAELQVLCNT